MFIAVLANEEMGGRNVESKSPKHIIAVSAHITNNKGETLLVKTHWRSDTWELPGGQVEEGEPLDEALCRELLEETGFVISPIGITGVYYNTTNHLLNVVFKAKYISGEIRIQEEEIQEAKFIHLTPDNIDQYITRPHIKSRAIDAIQSTTLIPYETWEISPYKRLGRVNQGDEG